jgi:hypothetical protein
MAERMDTFPDGAPTRRHYPWDEWLDGTVWRLQVGDDFSAKPPSMASMARARAAAKGKRCRVSIREDHIIIQAVELGR